MILLDTHTLFVVTAIINLYAGLMLVLYSRSQKIYAGFGLWLLGNIFFLFNFILFGLRGSINDFFSIVLANTFGIIGATFRLEGLRIFFKGGKPRLWLLFLSTFIFILYIYFNYIQPNIRVRSIIAPTVYAIVNIYIFLIILSSGTKNAMALFLGSFTLIAGIVGLGSMAFWIFNNEQNIFQASSYNSIIIIFILISEITWAVSLIMLSSQRMNDEITALTKQLEELASFDELTEIYNRRKFFEISSAELERAKRYNRPLSLIMFDLNNFKDINDTLGHIVGDQFLKKIVQVCKTHLRAQDAIGRFGGDEFVILLPETNLNDANEVAYRLNQNIQVILFEQNDMIKISMSYGIAESTLQDINIDQLIQRADELMYMMKIKKDHPQTISLE